MYTKRALSLELRQTEIHDGPYPPGLRCDDMLIRFTYMRQGGYFDTYRFKYNFDAPQVISESKVWVNLYSDDKAEKSFNDMLRNLTLKDVDDEAILDNGALFLILDAVTAAVIEGAVSLPQLAIDVKIWNITATAVDSFDDHDNSCFWNSWGEFKATTCSTEMPPLCAVCLDGFEESDFDKLVTRLPCSHYFHGHCISGWVNFRHTCPLCHTN